MTIDRAALEEALAYAEKAWTKLPHTVRLLDAARAYLETRPDLKTIEVNLVARMNTDATDVRSCRIDTPFARNEIREHVRMTGGQMVLLTGTAKVPR